ncbi:MAG TPA: hypothetical protein ENN98_00630 [Desulfurivibrio alkaliphilus]|uniref:Uncharacterized protein n=1 Tax=Desulfurivibrio alkaliphilus TaxID=427923 RepID=A0A7C2TJQ6_9BACT|nr:hypothetical protein [Desulfurivibrio alkaliphilus]
MPPISALYFPDLLPPPAAAILTELFVPLRCYRIAAAGRKPPAQDRSSPTPWAELEANGRLEFVQPLAADQLDLGRLHQLLGELEGRSGQDAALFVQGILAQLSAGGQETASELVPPLLGWHEDRAAREEEETLWRALLLLKLAELQERREQELTMELQELEARRAALFRQLQGDEEKRVSSARAMTSPAVSPNRNSARLLRAWGQLFLRDQGGTELLVSADPEAVALLLEGYGSAAGQEPLPLGDLPLPAGGGARLTPENRDQLALALARTAVDGESRVMTTALATCRQSLHLEGGEEKNQPGARVEFFLLPEISLRNLLAGLYRHPPRGGHREEAGPGAKRHGLIALLRR